MEADIARFYKDVIISEEEDILVWKKSGREDFDTKKFYNGCFRRYPPTPWGKNLWKAWILPKYGTFVWRLIHNGLPDDDNIRKLRVRTWVSGCLACLKGDENRSHLFVTCGFARSFWTKMAAAFGVRRPDSIEDICSSWLSLRNKRSFAQWLRIGLTCAGLWLIWKSRNERAHNEKPSNFELALRVEANNTRDLIPFPPSDLGLKILNYFGVKDSAPSASNNGKTEAHANQLNLALIRRSDYYQGGAILKDKRGSFLWGLRENFDAVSEEEGLLRFSEIVLKELQKTPHDAGIIQSSHPLMISGDGSSFLGSNPYLFYKFRALKTCYSFINFSRVCSYKNQAAIAMMHNGVIGSWSSHEELPRSVKQALLCLTDTSSELCPIRGCIHGLP